MKSRVKADTEEEEKGSNQPKEEEEDQETFLRINSMKFFLQDITDAILEVVQGKLNFNPDACDIFQVLIKLSQIKV